MSGNQPMTKPELLDHIATQHPELIYPPASARARWRKDELERQHEWLHEYSGQVER